MATEFSAGFPFISKSFTLTSPGNLVTSETNVITILLPLITYGGMCHTEFAMGVMGTLLQIQKSSDINMVVNPIVFESLISRARNAAAAFALQDDCIHPQPDGNIPPGVGHLPSFSPAQLLYAPAPVALGG